MVSELDFLAAEGLTTKDKLVLLTAHVAATNDANTIATMLNLGVASVRQSLTKDRRIDPEADIAANKEVQAAIIEVCGMERRSMRSSDWKLVAKVASELVEVGATGDEVRRRARNLSRRFHLWATPGTIDKYWAQLGDGEHPFSPRTVLR